MTSYTKVKYNKKAIVFLLKIYNYHISFDFKYFKLIIVVFLERIFYRLSSANNAFSNFKMRQ